MDTTKPNAVQCQALIISRPIDTAESTGTEGTGPLRRGWTRASLCTTFLIELLLCKTHKGPPPQSITRVGCRMMAVRTQTHENHEKSPTYCRWRVLTPAGENQRRTALLQGTRHSNFGCSPRSKVVLSGNATLHFIVLIRIALYDSNISWSPAACR